MSFLFARETLTVIQWLARAVVVFFWLLFVARIMGQREIGQLTLFDFVIAITIGSVAASPLSDAEIDVTTNLVTIGALGRLDVGVASLALKSSTLRRVLQEEPLILIQNGQILEDTLRKARINLDDLLMVIREKNVASIADVEFAILEPNGKFSVLPKSQARPVTPSDLNLDTGYEGLSTVLVEDGNILEDNLRENNLDEEWLHEQLARQDIDHVDDVLAAILDTQGRFYVSRKGQENTDILH